VWDDAFTMRPMVPNGGRPAQSQLTLKVCAPLRPVYDTRVVSVPRLHNTPIDITTLPITPTLLAVLEGGRAELKVHEQTALRYLQVAAVRDLHGVRRRVLADVLRYERLNEVSRDQAKGRSRWGAIGAWPWCIFSGGELPDDWRERPEVARALLAWASPGTTCAISLC
jgi:hypothetical protein